MARIILVTGGQRSGKSTYAERLALDLSERPVYVATAHVWDEEFLRRILAHQQRRGPQWENIEEERCISGCPIAGRVALIDCLTLWATNLFYDAQQTQEAAEGTPVERTLTVVRAELDRLASMEGTFILVTNELGSGGVSTNDVQRQFTDLQGWMNQYAAALADEVVLMVSGIPVKIKG